MTPRTPQPASPEAIFRFQVVSQVLARMRLGQPCAEAVKAVTRGAHVTLDGHPRLVSPRTLYRWLKAHREGGFAGQEPRGRPRLESSVVLPGRVLEFFRQQRNADPRASIPELVKRARATGVAGPDVPLNRITVWRAMRRMGLDTRRRKVSRQRDARRFAYPHRMQMILSDGKHFRAGITRAKRVALFFLDDATRYGLHVVVGTSEHTELFLRGLHETVLHHGLMDAVFLDRGPGFRSLDTARAIQRLDALWILGEAAYPEGHGKIEKFNQTAKGAMLRHLDRNPEVDPACGALELRLRHYLRQVYNLDAHESLGGRSPQQRWEADERPLRFPPSHTALRRKFVLHEERSVTADNVVPVEGVQFEMPLGHANTKVIVHRQLLDGTVAVLHDGRLVELKPVDLAANASSRRARLARDTTTTHPLPPSAAELAFRADFGPILGPDGGYQDDQED